ncbi:MAG: OmpA family protein [Gemmatimonadaceae bacterium]
MAILPFASSLLETQTGELAMRRTTQSLFCIAILSATAACSHKAPAGAAPAPATTAASDAAQREATERADADRRAAEERATAEAAAQAREALRSSLTTAVHFEFDRSEITEEGMRLLDAKVEALQGNPEIRIRVEGNADDSGSDEYNMVLSQKRAAVVSRYLTERGVEQGRIQIVAFGEERPACATGRDEPCRSKNRRDEFVVVSGL